MSAIFGWIMSLLGGPFVSKVLDYLSKRADTEVEKQRIASAREQALAATQASVIRSGMEHKAFWVPWLIATVPLAMWFGWGMLDTLANGRLPDVAQIPPGLEPWAKVAWQNLFYSGGGVAAASIIGRAIARR